MTYTVVDAILRGLYEHQDESRYLGSTLGLEDWCAVMVRDGWLEKLGVLSQAGIDRYHERALGALPETRWTEWK